MSQQHILVADDDQQLTHALALRLKFAGYEVTTATDGYNALARTIELHPDLLILDINMPAGDGFSVHDRLANATPSLAIPIIYISGDCSKEAQQSASAAGATALLRKPIDVTTLLLHIKKALPPSAA